MFRPVAYSILLLSILVYRSGNTFRNTILTKQDFPVGYYNGGNFTKDCTSFQLEGFKYCEDAAFWDLYNGEKGLTDRHLIVSCDPGRKAWNTVMGPLRNPKPHGGLWLYTSFSSKSTDSNSKSIPQRLTLLNYPQGHDFHPLGLDIWPSHARNVSNLYVVNHARQRTFIEHFELNPAEPSIARHVRTLTSPYFLSPNSIALTSPSSFYVSNDHLMTRRLPIVGHILPIMESILGLPLGFLSHVTLSPTNEAVVEKHTFAALFFPFPNGLALSPPSPSGKSTLAVASSSLAHVRLYDRDPATNKLTKLAHTVPVPFNADNVRFSDDGTLFIAGHPHFPTLGAVAANKPEGPHRAPSWAASIPPNSPASAAPPTAFDLDAPVSISSKVSAVPGLHPLVTVFQSNGEGFSTSSTALRDDESGTLYVTGLYAEEGLLVCRPSA
ncbi:hypothetical protein AX17_002288 [Amanita inopinata Kibby_2008]|nr:hypothetical protein AX17_002288 [Amanita inopinata Kibby_2008]